MCDEEKTWLAVLVTLLLISLGVLVWVVLTDEYEVREHTECVLFSTENGHCTKQQKSYSCVITHGETLRLCKEATECNEYCAKMRGN